MEPDSKANLIMLAVALALAGAVLIYTAVDSPALTAPAIAYSPPAVSFAGNAAEEQETPPEAEAPREDESHETVLVSVPPKLAGASNKSSSYGKTSSAAVSSRSVSSNAVSSAVSEAAKIRINLNTATLKEMMQLAELKIGVGETKVMMIYDYREIYGHFSHIEDILDIKGIGEKTYMALKPYIYVD